jgi:site-specific DNA-methyltransferase (adenine-specific)
MLIMSNLKMFKYEWIWLKDKPSNFMLAKKQPLKYHENILIFYKNQPMYNPNMEIRLEKDKRKNKSRLNKNNICNTKLYCKESKGNDDYIYPKSYQKFNKERGKNEHPTQKPVALFEYLIRTYTNEGDLVLDNCAGSGTTGVACKNLGRNYILIEKEKKYVDIARDRINAIPETLF